MNGIRYLDAIVVYHLLPIAQMFYERSDVQVRIPVLDTLFLQVLYRICVKAKPHILEMVEEVASVYRLIPSDIIF